MNKFCLSVCFVIFSLALTLPVEGENTDISAKIAACEKRCIITYDYQPKCGSDGNTYNNQRLLDCRDNCGKPYGIRVHKVSDAACPPKN